MTTHQNCTFQRVLHDQSYGFDCIVLLLAFSIGKHLSSHILPVWFQVTAHPAVSLPTGTQSDKWIQLQETGQVPDLDAVIPSSCWVLGKVALGPQLSQGEGGFQYQESQPEIEVFCFICQLCYLAYLYMCPLYYIFIVLICWLDQLFPSDVSETPLRSGGGLFLCYIKSNVRTLCVFQNHRMCNKRMNLTANLRTWVNCNGSMLGCHL